MIEIDIRNARKGRADERRDSLFVRPYVVREARRRDVKAIRMYRQRLGLTQQQLAVRAGVWQPEISRYENGVQQPWPHTLKKLAAGLETTPLELLIAEEMLTRRVQMEQVVEEFVGVAG
jgi:transcriptional regulator with XRE-family HTH domain